MATSSGSNEDDKLSRIEEEFQCSLCLDRLTNPKILPCFHSFCAECLDSWFHQCPDTVVYCPECRLETRCPSGISALSDDFRAKSVLDNLPKAADAHAEKKMCSSCEYQNIAVCGCLECSDLLCRECRFAHNRLKVTRVHTVLPCKEFNIQSKFLAIKDAPTVNKGLIFNFGGRGYNYGELQSPSCVCVHDDCIYVSDINGVHIFDKDGQFVKFTRIERLILTSFLWKPVIWSRRYWVLRMFHLTPEIIDMAFLKNGHMVYTTTYSSISICSPLLGNDFGQFSVRNIGQNVISRPWGVAVDSEDFIYAVDNLSGCVFCFDIDGAFVKKISCKGNGEGQLLNPTYISINSRDELFLSDTIFVHSLKFKRSVKVFDKRGHFICEFDTSAPISRGASDIYRSRQGSSVVITGQNQVMMLDPETRVVRMFTERGQRIKTVTKVEALKEPRGLCLISTESEFGGERELLVCVDKGDHCVKVFNV